MIRKTATAEKQPDLLGAVAPKVAPPPKPIAKVEPKPRTGTKKKTGTAVSTNVERLVPQRRQSLIDMLLEVSKVKDGDVAKTKEILAMIRAEEDRVSERCYNEALLAAQTEIPPIKRDTFNKHTKSFWARLEKISRVVDPIARKHGFSLSYGMETSPLPDHYRVICDVSHRDGHRRRYDADVGMDSKGPKGEGNKSLAQGSGSSITYARRFLKVMIFDVVVEGMDNDGNGAEARRATVIDSEPGEAVVLVSDKQAETLVDLIESKGRTRAAFCKAWQIDKVGDLPAADYQTAIDKLKALKDA